MGYDIGWIIPRLRNPGRLWYCASSFTVAIVGLFSKIIIELLNKTTVYNKEVLTRAVHRPPGVPLITVSNHHSCFDDPGLWGVLDALVLARHGRMRWSLAAHDICFTSALHAYFFSLGKCVPVVRGAGVHQPALDFCGERLARGEWVHVFPEGRVNVAKERVRLKWGVGRLVAECARPPLIVPLWHEGMDQVLPNREPYLLHFRRRVFLHVGEPIQVHHLLDRLRKANASEEETRKAITDQIQEELFGLRERAHALIRRTLGADADADAERFLDAHSRTDADAHADASARDKDGAGRAPLRNGSDRDRDSQSEEH